MEEIIIYFEHNIPNIFKKKRDLSVAYSILEIIKKMDEIENFNKKSLYILIREMSDVKTSQITSVVNVLKKHYRNIFENFYDTGTVYKNNDFFKEFLSFLSIKIYYRRRWCKWNFKKNILQKK